MEWIIGSASLLGILLGAEFFTNALEHLGERFSFSEGAIGSVFAAVGTALPEAMVPVVALFSGKNISVGQDVSVGAILGAPLMISTLSMGLLGTFVMFSSGKARRLLPEQNGLRRDLTWFQCLFGLSLMALFISADERMLRFAISLLLIIGYFVYMWVTIKASSKLVAEGHGANADQPLFTARLWGQGMVQIWAQLGIGVALIVVSAHGFVISVENLAAGLKISVLIISLFLIPVATELPEKINSLLWAYRGKDTLAIGNLTGALVFQGSLLPALGLWLTPWQPNPEILAAGISTLFATIWLQFVNRTRGIYPAVLIMNLAVYATFIGYLMMTR